jgi:hypothetical protein
MPGRLGCIQFPADNALLEPLVASCQPATFGRNNEDILDESYRKAGKLDRSQFSLSLDGAESVSLEKAGEQMFELEGDVSGNRHDIEVELYKVNVYGMFNVFAQPLS